VHISDRRGGEWDEHDGLRAAVTAAIVWMRNEASPFTLVQAQDFEAGRWWRPSLSHTEHLQGGELEDHPPMPSTHTAGFDAQAFLDSSGVNRAVVSYAALEAIYSQGGASDTVMYIQKGEVKLSVLSKTGREAIVAILQPGHFFGEGALTGQNVRIGNATAHTACTVLVIAKADMERLLHQEHALSDRFIAHLLTRNARIEEDLIDQLFNSAEKRLARVLLLLARYGEQERPQRVIPRISQETLAEMVGTTRSRVNFFMNRFKKLGFISGDAGITINSSLLSVVLHD
jgi:CRP-like cAMP-binding protein